MSSNGPRPKNYPESPPFTSPAPPPRKPENVAGVTFEWMSESPVPTQPTRAIFPWWLVVGLVLLLLWCAKARADAPPPFIIGVWQAPPEDVPKWIGRGANTFVGHVDNGGRTTKLEWENGVTAKGGFILDYPGDDVVAEAKQPNRIGFMQRDESDLSSHVDRPGDTPKDHAALYARVKPTGLPMYATFASFDNEWYDGHPKPNKTDGSKYGHWFSDGGWFANADIIGWDFYLYTNGRQGRFDVWNRLFARAFFWSGYKPVYLFIETNTQGKNGANGKPIPYTADQFEEEVRTAVGQCEAGGYKLAGVIYFSHQIYPNWKAFDITSAEISDRMTKTVNPWLVQKFGKPTPRTPPVTPPVVDPTIALLTKQLAETTAQLVTVRTDLDNAKSALTVAAQQLDAARAETATAKAALDISESTRKVAQSQAATLSETLKGPQPPPATQPSKPSALISQPPPEGTGDPRLGILNSAPGNYVAPWISPYDYTEDHVRTYARAVKEGGLFQPRNPNGTPYQSPILLGKNAPTAFDNENYDNPVSPLIPPERRRPDLTPRDVAKIFRQHLDWFRSEAPDAPVGLLGVAHNDDFAVAHEGATFITGGGYLMAAEWVERDLNTIRKEAADLRLRYPGKPLYLWVNPRFTDERTAEWVSTDTGYTHRGRAPLTPDVAARYVKLNRELGDQIVTWSELPFTDVVRLLGPELVKVER